MADDNVNVVDMTVCWNTVADGNVNVVGVTVCWNTVAGDNGTMLDYFTCPFNNEPSEYTYCYGESDAQYCCSLYNELVTTYNCVFMVTHMFKRVYCHYIINLRIDIIVNCYRSYLS